MRNPEPGLVGPPAGRYEAAIAAIDAANAGDPNRIDTPDGPRPKEVVHAAMMVAWVQRLDPSADELRLLAARAHHLCRWEIPRSTYPDGRAGYLRWRTAQKARHALLVGEILGAVGYTDAEIARVGGIIRKEGLTSDPAVQVHEDALCLVFLSQQLVGFLAEHGEDKTVEVIRKTARKMSPAGLAAVADLGLDAAAMALIGRAVGS